MKTIFVIISVTAAAAFLFYNKRSGANIHASQANLRETVSDENYFVAPYNLKWFDKDLNSVTQNKFRGDKGC